LCLLTTQALGQPNSQASLKLHRIERELEEIRGLKFKTEVKVENQSLPDFEKYLDRNIAKQFQPALLENYGKIIKKVGLYRGPEIEDFQALAKLVLESQAAAYYDPEQATFFLVMQDLPETALNAVYAHELYHGMQDQYHDLRAYFESKTGDELNDDQLLARQAVVEGEATYMMTLWTVKKELGVIPNSDLLGMAVRMQSNLDAKQLLQLLEDNSHLLSRSTDLQRAADKLSEIPRFMLETMVGSYLKGMGFIYEIQRSGWSKIDELYTRPPASTEQILHPEKWLNNEVPDTLHVPDLANPSLFKGWKLLETNTLGELQLRIVFTEYGLDGSAVSAAGGWNGDWYAVMQNRKKKDDLMLLLWTNWDDEKEATEFADAYEHLLKIKYASDAADPFRLRRLGTRVLVIEGGSRTKLSQRLAYIE